MDTAAAVTLVEKRSASHTFVMSGLDPGIYDEPYQMRALRKFLRIALPHGLHQNSGLPEFCAI